MNMAYSGVIFDGLITKPRVSSDIMLRDGLEAERTNLTAQVQSGDYFAMLATNLDLMSQTLAARRKSDSETLRKMVDDLLYLQQNYAIIKKLSKWTETITK